MNKTDLNLVIVTVLIALFIFMCYLLLDKNDGKQALVYYNSDLILTIDLTKNGTNKYQVEGKLGAINLVTEYGKIKVDSETSPLHLCSKQGYINSSYETIVCLPNRIVIKINSKATIDTVVR